MSLKSDQSLKHHADETAPVSRTDGDCVRALDLAFQAGVEEAGTIGSYKLLERIGEGGFGIVWMAEQEVPVRRRVALKVIKSGMDTREVIARFEVERQALAMMDHPHIARVFDAGETTAGRPYFVMELVRGFPITQYCDDNSLSTEVRLRLFISICHAVQHAHQKGIIHRDLKPSNIIVAQHGGVPFPKIIDFGIAKATEARLSEKTLFTQFHAFIGTPAYTSPEQMEPCSLDVDTRSDIYSLGVLLYELLAGQPPFEPDTLMKSGLAEMRNTIREVDPPRPSERVSTLRDEMRAVIARQRGTDGSKLPGRLRGDLDWIVMHCLEKDRTRRYESASELAADVDRHLRNEPVVARPATTAYRWAKVVRRHRVAFGAGAAVMLSLMTGLIMTALAFKQEQAARARESTLRAEADKSAAEARAAATKSSQIARFMNDMLGGVGPSVALGRDPSLLREMADTTVRKLETDLRNQPDVAADLRDTLGTLYIALGQMGEAEELLRAAVGMHRTLTGHESAETAGSLHLLCMALRLQRKTEEAEAAGQEALAIRQRLFGAIHPLVADTLFELAYVSSPHRRTADMRKMIEQVLAVRRHLYGDEHAAVAQAIAGLGTVAQLELDHAAGAHLHAEALAMRRRLLGNDHPEVAQSLAALGDCHAPELDRRSEAVTAYREAFVLRRKLLGDEHPKVLIPFLGLAGQLSAPTVSPEQTAELREFVERQRQLLPRGSMLLAPPLLALATLEPDPVNGTGPGGPALVEEARGLLDAARARGTPFDPEIIHAMMIFSWSKLIGNVPEEGRAMAEEAVKLAQAAADADEAVMLPVHTLGWINLSLGRRDTAVLHLENAVALLRVRRGDDHPVTLMDQAALAECYRAAGRITDARQLLEEALARHREGPNFEDADSRIGFITAELGITLLHEGRHVEAEAVLRQALTDYDRPGMRSLGRRLRPSQRALSALGLVLAAQGRFAEAEPLVLQAFEELRAGEAHLAGNRAGMVRDGFEAVLTLYRRWSRPEKVAEWTGRFP